MPAVSGPESVGAGLPATIRFLEEFDRDNSTGIEGQRRAKTGKGWEGITIKEGIKISANLNPIRLFFCRLFGMTVNIEIGNKTYACGRSSLEHFLRRHAAEAGLQSKIGPDGRTGHLDYADLAKGLQTLLTHSEVQDSIRKSVLQSSARRTAQDPGIQLYKDLANAQEQHRTVKVLGAYGSNLQITQEQLDALIEGSYGPPQPPAQLASQAANRENRSASLRAGQPKPAPAIRPNPNPVALPVNDAVAVVANAIIALDIRGPAGQEAALDISLAQQDPAAVATVASAVDDLPQAPPEPVAQEETIAIVQTLRELLQRYMTSSDLAEIKRFQEEFKRLATNKVVNSPGYGVEGENLLHFIAKSKTSKDFLEQSQILELLADLQIDFNKQISLFGNTPLVWAIANARNTTAMKMLHVVQAKKIPLQLNLLDKDGQKTVLHLILAKGYRKTDSAKNPLLYSNLQLAEEVIKMGADVNVQDIFGNTPLHIACLRRDYEAIQLLLKNGAKSTIRNKHNATAQELLYEGHFLADSLLTKYASSHELNKEEYDRSLERLLQLFHPE